MSELVKLEYVPLDRVNLNDPTDKARAKRTLKLCQMIAGSRRYDYLDDILKLSGRFPD